MTLNSPAIKRLSLFVIGFLLAVVPLPARSQDAPLSPASVPIVRDLSAFNLSTVAPFIPAGLAQSDHPTDGGRGVIGRDDRLPVTSRSYPWSAIGRVEIINADSQGHCTGSLIGADIVLTNAHCVINPETHLSFDRLVFLPNLVNDRLRDDADAAEVVEAWVGTDFQEDNQPPNPDDWALLKLDRSLGETYGTLGLAPETVVTLTSNYQTQLVMVGYSGDFPADQPGLTAGYHAGCSILGEAEGSLIHDCDTMGGASGGPILGELDGEPRIFALNSAEQVELPSRTGVENYAVDLSRIIEQMEAVR